MSLQPAIQNLLHGKFMEAKAGNPRYSLRAFARRLEISAGSLSAILSGKRVISKKLAEKIADRLGLDDQSRSELLKTFVSLPRKRDPIQETLRLAKSAWEKNDPSHQDFSSLTLAFNPEKLGKAKEMIQEFQSSLSGLFEEGENARAYRLAIQLFPVPEPETQASGETAHPRELSDFRAEN